MTFLPRIRRLALGAGLALAVIGLAVPALGAEVGVSIVDKAFQPTELTVHAGDTVTWTVTKSIGEPHSVKSGMPTDPDAGSLFDSGIDNLKDNGQAFRHTFAEPGTVEYFCIVHPEMTGQVVVLEAGESEAGVPTERRLLAAGILAVTLVVLFAAARVWRRMNPA